MSLDIHQLLSIEDDKNILEFRYKYKNTLIWPFIRYSVMYVILSNELVNNNTKPIMTKYHKTSEFNITQSVLKRIYALIKNPFFSFDKSIMFLYGCTGNVLDSNGIIYNRIFDEFVKIYGESTYVLDCSDRDLLKKSLVKKHYSCMIDSVINVLVSKTKAEIDDINTANQFLKYLKSKISPNYLTSAQWSHIKETLLMYSKKIKFQDEFYRTLFRFIHPKIVFIEDGCYGERNAYLCKLLKEEGIISAEIQHALIGETHPAYNYGEAVRTSIEYKKYMPDYFCGMSDYFMSLINAPVKKYCIGNPIFYEQYRKLYEKSKLEEKNRTQKVILWLGFDDVTQNLELLNNFLLLSKLDYKIIVRIHPMLYSRDKIYYKKMCEKYSVLSIDFNSESHSIYEAFVKCDYIVSEYSTVIYEAKAFGKKVFIYNSKVARYHKMYLLGEFFTNAEELLELLQKDNNFDNIGIEKQQYFDKHWKRNYKAFIKEIIH